MKENNRENYLNDQRDLIRNIFDKWFELKRNLVKTVSVEIMNFLNQTQHEILATRTESQIKSKNFNVLDFFSINETIHSSLLANLLNPISNHGQSSIFLYVFLDFCKMTYITSDPWNVYSEKSRVDILLECRANQKVIIIENKSFNAIDQPNQLYRYWYYDIYQKYPSYFQINNLPKNLPENFKIIYLVPNKLKKPEDHSLCKPSSLNDVTAPTSIPREWITIWNYKEEIASIVQKGINLLHEKNHRLREYLVQYLEKIKELN